MSRICIVQPSLNTVSETFIRAHDDRLPGVVAVVHTRDGLPAIGDRPVLSQHWLPRSTRKLLRTVLRRDWIWEVDSGYEAALRRSGADVVLAEYGPTAVGLLKACRGADVPLVAHFHGFDASRYDVLEAHADGYQTLFEQSAAVVAVSQAMAQRLQCLGCPGWKIICNPCGCEALEFSGGNAAAADPRFVAVGRMVEKKGPYLTIAAFARVFEAVPQARLRMIGDGPLLGVCRDLCRALGVDEVVTFLGAQPHDVVQREMRQARAFVQHSIVASCGDSEGTPVAVLEAGAMGVPVIGTRHAGIPDVVVDGETGLLVDERDVAGMAEHMLALARNPALAGDLGRNAASHVRKYYTMEQSIRRLGRVLEAAAMRQDISVVRESIAAEFPGGHGMSGVTRLAEVGERMQA